VGGRGIRFVKKIEALEKYKRGEVSRKSIAHEYENRSVYTRPQALFREPGDGGPCLIFPVLFRIQRGCFLCVSIKRQFWQPLPLFPAAVILVPGLQHYRPTP
jgi:hypothetical protein